MDLFLLLFKCNIFFSNYSQSIIEKDPTSLMADYTFLRHLVSTSESAQCNRKSAICGLKNPIGQSSRSLAQTKRIVGSGDEIVQRSPVFLRIPLGDEFKTSSLNQETENSFVYSKMECFSVVWLRFRLAR